jgi:hypothetical protein
MCVPLCIIMSAICIDGNPGVPCRGNIWCESPQDGQTVAPGSTLNWHVWMENSTGPGLGLSGVLCNFRQDTANPSLLDLTPGSRSTAMLDWDIPRGICNRTSSGLSAFGGSQRGNPGARDLIQLGGMQNTLGIVGATQGIDAVVEVGVGRSGPVLIASGSFITPSAPGVYRYYVDTAKMLFISAAPAQGIRTSTTLGLITVTDDIVFTVSAASPCDPLDFNQDSLFPDTQDIADFLSVYGGGLCAGQSAPPPCNSDIDFNNDGLFPDTQDIDSILSVFAGGPCL